jgi:hypothetical protein
MSIDLKKLGQVTLWALFIETVFFFACSVCFGAEFKDEEIVNAIYKAEGGHKAVYPYGIRSVKTNDPRKVCFNTVKNNRVRFVKQNKHKDFISFLGSRYCPTTGKISRREKEVNRHWIKNVNYFLTLNRKNG